jgi:putative transposase
MPRANRYHLPGQIWHITQRCHKGDFLFKFAKDRKAWVDWLFEATKRYGLIVLDYIVTSNHIHLLVVDDKSDAISKSIQLIAGRTAREFNRRKGRRGAYWEDRYHATAIECGEHLLRCLVYIDMNMVRAGAVSHPSEWVHGGYREIQQPPLRYRLIDREKLIALCDMQSDQQLVSDHQGWIELAVQNDHLERQEKWSEAVCVGSEGFVKQLKHQLGSEAPGRKVKIESESYVLREPDASYDAFFDPEKESLGIDNGVFFDEKSIELKS